MKHIPNTYITSFILLPEKSCTISKSKTSSLEEIFIEFILRKSFNFLRLYFFESSESFPVRFRFDSIHIINTFHPNIFFPFLINKRHLIFSKKYFRSRNCRSREGSLDIQCIIYIHFFALCERKEEKFHHDSGNGRKSFEMM